MTKSLLFLVAFFLILPAAAQTATRIIFDNDPTRAMVAGKVPENSMQVFTLEGHQQQPVGFYLMSSEGNGNFEVTTPDGGLLGTGTKDKFGGAEWKGTLPADGEYTVVVFSDRGLADFQLTVTRP